MIGFYITRKSGEKKVTRGLGSKVHTNDDYGTTPENQSNLEK